MRTGIEYNLMRVLTYAALMLCGSGFLFARGVAAQAQEGGTQGSATCGQTRSVLMRFLDGKPASGVEVSFAAASPDMGGPELYVAGGVTGSTGQSAPTE